MSRSRRDFLRLAGVGAVAAGVIVPNQALACCFGRRRSSIGVQAAYTSNPVILNPLTSYQLARTFTAYGTFSLGYGTFKRITSTLSDGSTVVSGVCTWSTASMSWMADYDIPSTVWPDGAMNLTLKASVEFDNSAPYTNAVDQLTLVGVNDPGKVTITNPSSNSMITTNPDTNGAVIDPSTSSVKSQYFYQGGYLDAEYEATQFTARRWTASHDLSGKSGLSTVSLVVRAKNSAGDWNFTASRSNLTIG